MKNILICLLALTACSAPMEVEGIDVSQQALGTCPRPTGGGGDPTFPFNSYITGVLDFGAGATQIFGYGRTAAQYVRFGYDTGAGTAGSILDRFAGPELDRCDYP